MKKSLIALAALAATGAFAQSSVTIYGVADVGFKTQTISDGGRDVAKASGVADGAMAGQRFGFRGTEDLGGGLKANFVIEQGISMTSQSLTNVRTATSAPQVEDWIAGGGSGKSATNLNRQSWVGLSGGFGEVRLGYQYTNLYETSTLSGFNIGSEGTNGADTAHTFGFGSVGGARANGVTYITPEMSGFRVNLQYGSATDALSSESSTLAQRKAERTGVMVSYNAGPLSARLTHTNFKNGTAAAGTAIGAITTQTGKLTQLGASYNLGVAVLGGTYNTGEDGYAGLNNTDLKSYQVGARVPFGAWSFIATTGKAEATRNAVKLTDAKQTQLGVNYALSKRTTVYAYTGTTKDNGVDHTANGAAAATTVTDKRNSTIFGVLHTF